MAQHSIVKLAKQGNPKAIAFLITQTLHQYGITARASRKGTCLKLLLEAEQVPHPATMSRVIYQGMQKLSPLPITTIKLYGRQKGQKAPAWRQVVEIASADQPAAPLSFLEANDRFNDKDDRTEPPIFQLDNLDPDAMILLPIEPQMQLTDITPDAMILLPVDPALTEASTEPAFTETPFSSNRAADSSIDDYAAAEFDLESADTEPSSLEQPPIHPSNIASFDPAAALPAIKLPKPLTRALLGLLWLQLILYTLILIYSLLSAGSFSLYTGLDLVNTNLPFASLLSAVVGIADFLFAPLARLSLWVTTAALLLFLFWLYRLHISLKQLFGSYPISPTGAIVRFILPLYNFWGVGNVYFTLAKQLNSETSQSCCWAIRRLTRWFYLLALVGIGLQGFYIWAISVAPISVISDAANSLWFFVARDAVVWLLALVWLRLVRTVWRAVRRVYRERNPIAPALTKARTHSSPVNIKAILLGGGTILLSLILFNCVLGLIASIVFVSSGLQAEAILPTFFGSKSLLILVLVGSCLCVGLGGFLTASLAPVSSMLHVFGLGVLLTLAGLGLQRLPHVTDLPFWFQTASAALIIPAVLLGGGLRQWLKTL